MYPLTVLLMSLLSSTVTRPGHFGISRRAPGGGAPSLMDSDQR
jgi:hypothetical protein